jgi:hypothetical protein
MTILAAVDAPAAYAFGGYELKLSPTTASAFVRQSVQEAAAKGPTYGDAPIGMSEEDARLAAEGALKAAMAFHAPSLRMIFEYHIDADSWWRVPSSRQWSVSNAFDWRHAPLIETTSKRLAQHAMDTLIPRSWFNTPENLTAELPAWYARNLYVGVDEYARPQPARCRHGRSLLGCLRGIGVQRDEFGNEVEPLNRSTPDRLNHPPAWQAPLRLAPADCVDCVLLLPPSGSSTDAATVVVPPDPDIYQLSRLARNATGPGGADGTAAGAAATQP